jgi:hypothetical protein
MTIGEHELMIVALRDVVAAAERRIKHHRQQIMELELSAVPYDHWEPFLPQTGQK